MYTIYKGLCLPAGAFGSLSPNTFTSCGNELRHTPVGKEHELLNQPVGLLGNFLIHIHRTTFLIHNDLHFRAFKADCTACKPLLAKF